MGSRRRNTPAKPANTPTPAAAAGGETKAPEAAPQGGDSASETSGNPNPEETAAGGQTTPQAPDPAPAPQAPTPAPATKKETGREKLLKDYAKRYPGNKTFHITTDNQVFLAKDKHLAENHQRSLKDDGTVDSVTVD
jgi:hypothetical protein